MTTIGLLAGLGLSGCAEKEDVAPEPVDCDTMAVVRLCPGKTAACPTEHTTLELSDGTRLRPTGPLWEAYRTKPINGQPLRISYSLVTTSAATAAATVSDSEPAITAPVATITCLTEISWGWCGTGSF